MPSSAWRRNALLLVLPLGLTYSASCAVYEAPAVSSSTATTDPDAGGAPSGAAGSHSLSDAGEASSNQSGGTTSETGGSASAGTGAGGVSPVGGGGVAGAGGSAGNSAAAGAGGTSVGASGSNGAGGRGGAGGSAGASPVQLAVGKSATASSAEGGHDAAKGNDKDLSTRWCAINGSFPQWWRVDLGAVHALNQVTIRFEHADRTYSYQLETSTNDSVYTLQKTLSGTSAVQTTDLAAGVSARYVRVTVTSATPVSVNGSGTWASFFDFSVSGT